MSAPQEASQDETSRNSTAHGQTSLTLPPIRSLDLSLSRPDEHQVTDQTFQTQQQAQVRSPGDIHVSTSSQPRRDGVHQWRPYSASQDSNPTGQPAAGSVREAPLAFGRPYATDTNYPSSFVREPPPSQPTTTTTQFRTLSGAAPHGESSELSTLADSRGGARRGEPAYSSSATYSPEHLTPHSQSHTSRSLDRSASMIDVRHEFRGPASGTQSSYGSPAPSNFAPPQNFGTQSSQFPLSRPSFSTPGYPPSSPVATFHQQSSHREDSATNTTTSSSGMPTYSHATYGEAMPTTSTTATPFHPRSWTDQNPHSTAAVEISGASRPLGQPPAGGARIGTTDRWGPSSPELLSHSPSGRASISSGHGQVPRHRPSSPFHNQPQGVAKLSTSISEVCFRRHSSEIIPPCAHTFPIKFQIVNHCVALTHFAKHYGEHIIHWQQRHHLEGDANFDITHRSLR